MKAMRAAGYIERWDGTWGPPRAPNHAALVSDAATVLASRNPEVRAEAAARGVGIERLRYNDPEYGVVSVLRRFMDRAEQLVQRAELAARPGADGHAVRRALFAMLRRRTT
jgi:hypothetical protein